MSDKRITVNLMSNKDLFILINHWLKTKVIQRYSACTMDALLRIMSDHNITYGIGDVSENFEMIFTVPELLLSQIILESNLDD